MIRPGHNSRSNGLPVDDEAEAAIVTPYLWDDGGEEWLPAPYIQEVTGTVTVNEPVTVDGTVTSNLVVPGGALTDRSGDIDNGGTAQDIAALNAARKYFFLQNISDTDMWFNWGVDAVADQPSIKLAAGANYETNSGFIPTGRVSLICATTGKKYVAKEG